MDDAAKAFVEKIEEVKKETKEAMYNDLKRVKSFYLKGEIKECPICGGEFDATLHGKCHCVFKGDYSDKITKTKWRCLICCTTNLPGYPLCSGSKEDKKPG